MTCRWDREAEDYLRDGEPCRRDDYGDPTKHCTARRGCSNHIGKDELTCARCVGRTRTDIKRIADLSPLMLPVALGAGVNSEAANLAGPAADYAVFVARRRIDQWWIEAHLPERNQVRAMVNLLVDDDEFHPYSVLTRWHLMLAEDYRLSLPDKMSISDSATFLEAKLSKVAQDDEQDFPLLAREMRKCRAHLEAVMRNSVAPERGATCPSCHDEKPDEPAPRLTRQYGHWCTEEDCEQIHYLDDSGDVWKCPRSDKHEVSHEHYRKYIDMSGKMSA